MAQLKDVQAKIPSADTIVGRVIAYHEGKHYDLGAYVGDGVVQLSPAGEALMKPAEDTAPAIKRVARKASFPGVSDSDLG